MTVAVDIFLMDDSTSPAPIAGAVVAVLNPSTFAEVAQATTDSLGRAAFFLPGTTTPGTLYEVRFFKLGVRFANPAAIRVLEPVVAPASNLFNYTGTLVGTLPDAMDPRVCRCTGRFLNYQNQPLAYMTLRVFADQDGSGVATPTIVDGNLIAAQSMTFTTDSDGYLSIDLLRGGEYKLMFPGEEETLHTIYVPDRTSANLVELIYPYPVTLTWDQLVAPGNAITVGVGVTVTVTFTVLFSNYMTISKGMGQWLTFTNGDNTVMEVVMSEQGLATISGKSPGTAQLTGANQPNLLPSRVPYYNTLIPTLNVTVIP